MSRLSPPSKAYSSTTCGNGLSTKRKKSGSAPRLAQPPPQPATTLTKTGEAQNFFLRELQSTNRIVRSQVADAIHIADFHLPAAVPLLMQDLGDRQEKPYNEFLALSVIGPDAKAAVPFVVAQMDDPAIQGNALTALIGIGQNLKPAVPALIQVLQGTNEIIRPAAAEALMIAGPDAVDALPALTEAKLDPNPVIGVLATAAIGRITGDYEAAVAGLR